MVPAERPSGNRADRTESQRAAYHSRMIPRSLRPPAAIVLAACTAPDRPPPQRADAPTASAPTPARRPSPTASPATSTSCCRALDSTHPDAWHGIAREDFVAALDEYEAALPDYTPDEAVVELMRVVALLSREGRDGHQFAVPQPGSEGPALPITVYEFDEGVTITAAAPPHTGLVGGTITAVAGTPDRRGAGGDRAARPARRAGNGARLPADLPAADRGAERARDHR